MKTYKYMVRVLKYKYGSNIGKSAKFCKGSNNKKGRSIMKLQPESHMKLQRIGFDFIFFRQDLQD
jgi:hypothetical protein